MKAGTIMAATPVDGWNYDPDRAGAAPVVVNPLAADAAVADWALSQARRAQVLLDFLHLELRPDGVQPEVIAAVAHFQAQAVCVLAELQRRLATPADASAG